VKEEVEKQNKHKKSIKYNKTKKTKIIQSQIKILKINFKMLKKR
jgi:hypothetical protein